MLAVARDGDLSPLRAWSHGLGEGWVGLVSCRWCSSWLNNGGGLNHEAHKGHESRMGEFRAMGELSEQAGHNHVVVG